MTAWAREDGKTDDVDLWWARRGRGGHWEQLLLLCKTHLTEQAASPQTFSFFSPLHANIKLSGAVLIRNQLVAFKVSCVLLHLTCCAPEPRTHAHTLTFAILCACWAVWTLSCRHRLSVVSFGRSGPFRLWTRIHKPFYRILITFRH